MHNRFLLFISIFASCVSCFKQGINPVVVYQSVGEKRHFIFNATIEYVIVISNLTNDLVNNPPRIEVECLKCNELNPALVAVREKKQISSFKLPRTFTYNGQKMSYNKTAQTLCPDNEFSTCFRNFNDEQLVNNVSNNFCDVSYNNVIVTLSTSSEKNIKVILNVSLVTNFKFYMNEISVITLTFNAPQFFSYEFPNNTQNGSVLLKVSSRNNSCILVSIQNKSCPMIDTTNPYYKGYFQTVTHLGAITIMRDNFPFGFYAVFSLYPVENHCHLSQFKTEDSKIIEISMHNTLSEEYYVYVILITVALILGFCTIILVVSYFSFLRKDVVIPDLRDDFITNSQEPSASVEGAGRSCKNQDALSPVTEDTLTFLTDSSLDETDIDCMNDAELDKNVYRTKTVLRLSDLAKKKPIILKKKSELYFWNLMTVATFYLLPAIQLVVNYQYNLQESGNQDLCYYNFLCSHPWRNISDLNHVFSNIGYVSLGLLFLIVTFRKDQVHNVLARRDIRLDREYGVPQHFGLYYAMGTSLIIEGILSASYHICPNIYNFQFDTSFMYIISALCMIKIYQSRHPDVNATAYSTFFVMAGVIVLGICGIFNESRAFWGIFIVLHFTICFYLTMKVYYVGRLGFDFSELRFFREFQFCPFSKDNLLPLYPKRFFLLAIINVYNWSLSIGALVLGVKDFASFLLIIFVVNLIFYTTFYIIMKIMSNERILLQTLLYIISASLCWSVALYYFFNGTISWKKTPAESRLRNKPCALLDFYDNHDIWHFISSIGLFFSFMVLLTLDDDLIFVHRSEIPVF